MYARVTTYQADASRLDELEAKLDAIKGQVQAIAGIVNVYSVWRADGKGVVTAIYETQAAADAASEAVQAIWGGLMEFLQGTPSTETYDRVAHMTG